MTNWWGGPLHVVLFLLFLALLVAGIVWLVRRLSPSAVQAAAPAVAVAPATALAADPAIATLRMRYAKGEVSREDFQHAMEDLTGVAEPTAATSGPPWPGSEPGEDTAPTAS